ncbi:peptidoglycan-binding protein [Endozoicomonas sp. SM1973]|uniref:Peptidoglycan-binding protein n=1 Tax=Spartinivicinus marinus TaxID=2994442 RepID=A0A853I0N9_9GAMM|nr:peptidoglycan-binding domain-containing protein [Spartinivicinus marinus]MCX4029780.1 peptidoglycan-binding domain-containing protein [Spartinivicinus marinus]NYZ67550.1 peptidoglycan-binding protein [Spartinivicinus marinus]
MIIKNGCQGEDVKSVQEILKKLGYNPGLIDGIFGEKTDNAVIQFQEDYCLYADGIVGQNTWGALHNELAINMDEQVHPLTSHNMQKELLAWVRVPADKYRDGYDRFFLREDVATAYMKIRQQVVEAGGKLTSSGARRALNAHVGASRSATSFHYIGRALDLFVGSGMENRARDPFVVTPEGDRYWRVFARAEGGEKMELNAVTYGARRQGKWITGKFIDITTLFEKEGFKRIRARRSFFSGGSWLGAEWWHFQYEKGLEKDISTFGGELLKVYTEGQLQETPPWQYRNRIYSVDWF